MPPLKCFEIRVWKDPTFVFREDECGRRTLTLVIHHPVTRGRVGSFERPVRTPSEESAACVELVEWANQEADEELRRL
jgi:hypothetical protein